MVDQRYKDIAQEFAHQLHDSSNGKKTSLPFIQHIRTRADKNSIEQLTCLVIGGTVYRQASCRIENDEPILTEITEAAQPPFLHASGFLDFIESRIDGAAYIGLNFAYPLAPVDNHGLLDGVLVSGSKENTFNGLVGKQIGTFIQNHIEQKLGKKVLLSVANDTVCLLLSGLTETQVAEHLVGGVIGTGLNFALFEKGTIVNLESANFNGFDQSAEGKEIDRESAAPGSSLFEKEVSGAYLYKHFNILCRKKGIESSVQSTEELNQYAEKDSSSAGDIAREVITRAATLAATQIAGIMIHKQSSITVVMEGSLFWKGYRFKSTIEETIHAIVPEYTAHFIHVANSDLVGAAKLFCYN